MNIKNMSERSKKRIARALLRSDFHSFANYAGKALLDSNFKPPVHYQAVTAFLDRMAKGEVRRGIINLPPQHHKSFLASNILPSFLLGNDPKKKIILASYEQPLATAFTNKLRNFVASKAYRDVFGDLKLSKNTETELTTKEGGSFLGVSLEGGVTGRGADVIIIDDPLNALHANSATARKNADNAVKNIMTRLSNRREGIILVVMQRLHIEDPTATLLGWGNYELLKLPLVAEEDHEIDLGNGRLHKRSIGDILNPLSHSVESIEELKNLDGEYAFKAIYQQDPIKARGNIFKRDELSFYEEAPKEGFKTLISWDVANSKEVHAHYSAGTVWKVARGNFYLVDVIRGKFDHPTLRSIVVKVAFENRPALTIVEDTSVSRPLIDDLRDKGLTVRPYRPELDKGYRAQIASKSFRDRRVFLPRSAPWLECFVDEISAYPSNLDDQVDSAAQALIVGEHIFRQTNDVAVAPIQVGQRDDFDIIGHETRAYQGTPDSEPAVVWRLAKKKEP